MIHRAASVSVACALWLAAPLAAQVPPSFVVSTQPATLVRGTVGLITIRPPAGSGVTSLGGLAAD